MPYVFVQRSTYRFAYLSASPTKIYLKGRYKSSSSDESICCEKDNHYKCSHKEGCIDNKDRGTAHIKFKLFLKSKYKGLEILLTFLSLK